MLKYSDSSEIKEKNFICMYEKQYLLNKILEWNKCKNSKIAIEEDKF